jgi:CheY-like chemotaxis protein
LKQILMNVIGNAIKFTNVGHVRVTVKANRSLDTKQQFVDFFIEDTGIGIEDALKSELFQPFSQLDDSSTRRFGGTGLGLAISRRLARDLGGDLRLSNSIPGVGSIFHLRIAAPESNIDAEVSAMESGAETEAQNSNENALQDLNILLVEDSADNQDFFSYYLTKAGANVAVVGDGFEAVHKAHNQKFDLILMDVQLPGIDGKEATRRIRGHGFGGPIIALTAHARRDERENCFEAGCGGHIAKPVSGERLVDEVYRYAHSAPARGINSPHLSS